MSRYPVLTDNSFLKRYQSYIFLIGLTYVFYKVEMSQVWGWTQEKYKSILAQFRTLLTKIMSPNGQQSGSLSSEHSPRSEWEWRLKIGSPGRCRVKRQKTGRVIGAEMRKCLIYFWHSVPAFLELGFVSLLKNSKKCWVRWILIISTAIICSMIAKFPLICALTVNVNHVHVWFFTSSFFVCPDTFASKVAAIQDQYADASIGNVTGSNAVNVFLGIGVSVAHPKINWFMQWSLSCCPSSNNTHLFGILLSELWVIKTQIN